MQKASSEELQKKSRKKKHNRSRSRSQKRRKRSRSRSEHKKDKKDKRKRQKQSYRDKEKQEQVLKENRRQKLPKDIITQELNTGKDSSYKQQQVQKNYQGSRKRDKQRQQSRDNDRKKDHYHNKQRSKYQDRQHRQRSKYDSDYQNERERDRDKRKQREKENEVQSRRNKQRNRQEKIGRQRGRQRETSRERQYDNQREKRRQRSRQKQSQSNRNLQRFSSKRRSRTPERRRQREQRERFRFDSPPKSDESDISDDPEKMQKLNRTKAEQELVTSKADKKLYLGNLPPNITSQQLMDMLNVALKKMEINTDVEGDSIISAWISPDGVGHYAFVQFRTAQQATNGLALNGASLFGYQLKLGRPKQYIEYNKQMLSKFGTDSSIDTILKKVEAIGGEIEQQVSEKIVQPPSRIIVLKHIVTVDELAIDEEYQQILDDVKDMAKRFGDVIKVVIPRPHEIIDLQQVQKRVKGLGYIFVEYRTIEQAIFARKQFIQKQFSGRSVACSFFEDKRWRQSEYDICEKVFIDF